MLSVYSGFVVGVVVLCGLVVMWPLAEVKVILTCLVAPCPMRMDSYLCKHYEMKSPLHTSSMSLVDGPEIQNVMLCVFSSVSVHQCKHSPELTNPLTHIIHTIVILFETLISFSKDVPVPAPNMQPGSLFVWGGWHEVSGCYVRAMSHRQYTLVMKYGATCAIGVST